MNDFGEKRFGNKRNILLFWLQAAVIGAAYAALTMVLAPISYGPVQVRVSEALTVLPFFTPAAVPGLFIGCLVSNAVMSPYPLDFIIGSSATLVAALLSYALRKIPWLVPLPPVIVNGAAIGAMLYYLYGVPPSLWADMGFVALGEAVACYAVGIPLMKALGRCRHIFEYKRDGSERPGEKHLNAQEHKRQRRDAAEKDKRH
ncbi:MAG: QueT transporter family protein [Clostridiales Family XIII bacterium]|jgi:uncharacterized membrane protein|nr:QueT transporter family protein [Clostridiales Family XIII bacterium]